jgi:hypothetical protein
VSRLIPRLRLLPVVWLVGLLALPVILLVLGVRQPAVTNATKAPGPPIDGTSLRHAATFQALDAYLLDRFPLRDRALDLYGNIAVDLFHESTNPIVSLGQHGWLYYVPETADCTPDGQPLITPQAAADGADVLARALVASGRNTTVVFAGSKFFTHTKDAPHLSPAVEACASAINTAIQQRLATTPGGLDLQPQLDRLERQGLPVFLKSDTHWNWRGREVYVRDVLDRIEPGFAEAAGIHPGPDVERPGDLGKLMGITRDDSDPALVADHRPPPPKPGDVLLIGDSQTEKSLLDPTGAPGVAPLRDVLLPGTPSCNWTQLEGGVCDQLLRDAHTVVIEAVGRDVMDFDAYRCWRPIALVGERMRGVPGSWKPWVDGPKPVNGSITIPASGSVTVTFHPSDGDLSRLPRLERLPIDYLPPAVPGAPAPAVSMTQQPQNGPPAPCAMPLQSVVHAGLFLPIPADRSTNDLVITLTGPAGARIGRPQTIPLDGHPVSLTPP